MSDKHLTEAPWKTLAKQQKIAKDAGLAKALADYSNAAEDDHSTRLAAIDEIKAGVKKLQKEHGDKKEVEEYLDEVFAQAEKTRKAVEALQKAADKDDGEEEDDEEAAEYRKDLKSKLKSALNQVKSRAPGAAEEGEAGKPQLKFMAFVAGKACAVLVARKVGSSAKKLLPEIAGVAGSGKFLKGECIFEKNVHTFVLDQVPAGLAKKLGKALLAETEMKYKVRVRSTDGTVDLDSDTDADPDEIAAPGAVPPTATEPAAQEEKAPPAPPVAPPEVRSDDMVKFTERLKVLIPLIKAKPNVKAFPGTPGEKGLNVLAADAGGLAKARDFAKANEALDIIESALKTAPGAPPVPEPKPSAKEGEEPEEIKLSTYLFGRANLRKAREAAEKELERLQQAILAKAADEPFFKEIEAKSEKLLEYLDPIDNSVADKLDEASTCPDAEKQMHLNKKVRELIQIQLGALRSHALASFVASNPFGTFSVRQPLEAALSDLDGKLS